MKTFITPLLRIVFFLILSGLLIPENLLAQGNTCATAISVTVPQTLSNQTTCNKGADYNNYCGFSGGDFTAGPDVVYRFTVPKDGCIEIKLTGLTGQAFNNEFASALFEGGCPGTAGSKCLGQGSVGWVGGNGTIAYRGIVTTGKTYYIVVDVGDDPVECITSFTFSIDWTKCPPPVVTGNEGGIDCGQNLGFEQGNATNWTGRYNDDNSKYNGPPVNPPINGFKPATVPVNGSLGACGQSNTVPANSNNTASPRHTVTSGGGTDPNTNNVVPIVAPGGGTYSFRLGNQEPNYGCECVQRTFTPDPAKPIFTYLYAIVSNDEPDHADNIKARFEMSLKDPSGNIVPCGGQYVITSGAREGDGFIQATNVCGGNDVYYSPWRAVSVDLTPYIGQTLTLQFCTSDCAGGAHYSYAYIDAYCYSNEIKGTTLCTTSGSVTLTAPIGFTNYTWYNGGFPVSGSPIGTGPTITVNPTSGAIYTVTYENYQGTCTVQLHATDTIKVLNATVDGDTTLCNNATGTHPLIATSNDPTATYTWSPATNLSCTNCPNPNVTLPLSATRTYTVTISSPLGCTVTRTVTVTVQPCQPNVTATGDTICRGSSGTVSAVGSGGQNPLTYTWTPNIGSGAGPHLVNPTSTTIYTVTVRDAGGATATATTRVLVNNPPTLSTTKTDTQCGQCVGSATVTATGSNPYNYVWTPGGATTQSISALCPGNYKVVVTDVNGCVDSTSVTVSASNSPTVTTTTTNATCPGICNGTATATSSGGQGTLTYTWAHGPTGATVSNLCAGTVYTVTVSDASGCTNVATATLTEPVAIVLATTSANVSCPGACNGTANVNVTSGGTPNFSYSWNTTPSQTTANATGLCTGTFIATVTDANGCTKTATVTITEPAPIVLSTTTTNVSCYGQCNGSANVSITSGGTPNFSYSWNTTPPQTAANATGLCAGTYVATVTDANGCTATTSVTITQPAPIVLQTSGQSSGCAPNGTASVTVTSGGTPGFTYIWNPSGQTTTTATGLSPGTYCVTVTDTKGCTEDTCVTLIPPATFTLSTAPTNVRCAGGSDGAADLTVTGGATPLTYSWSPGNFSTEDISNLTAGTYTVTVRDANGCLDTAMVTITEPPPITLTTSKTDPTCTTPGSATATAAGGTGTLTYLWSDGQTSSTANGLNAQSYTVTVTDANGCTKTASTDLSNPGLPKADFIYSGGCLGTPTVFTNQSSAGTGDNITAYLWDFGDSGTDAQQNPQHTYAAPCTYNVTLSITTGKGCTATASKVVDVDPIPVANFGPPASGCMPVCVNFADSSTIDPCGKISQWQWDFGDGSNGTTQNPNHCYSAPGSYSITLTVTSDSGCKNTLSRPNIINVYPYPSAEFTMSPTETEILFPTINFFDLSTGNPVTWRWDFGVTSSDSDTSVMQNPVWTYTDTGTYTVCLYITNQYGCEASICHPVLIKPIWTFYIPNAFTPDGDGNNDFFIGKGYNIIEHQMWIFDRWGDLIYTTGKTVSPESSIPWNGRANGGSEIAQEDVYIWLVKFTDIFGKKHRMVGSVTLVR
jgi:gliding motility-associated-like protein